MVIVSHDRHLIKTVADSLWVIADGKLTVFDGDLDDYQQGLRAGVKTGPAESKSAAPKRVRQDAAGDPRAAARAAALKSRGRMSALRRELEQIEKRIAAIAAERSLIEEELCKDPMHRGLQAQHADLMRDAASMETRWMELGTALEAVEHQAAGPD
jgi:ATP-binding cassette subfamily F protein 3